MEIEIICRSKERKELLRGCAEFYAKKLNLENSRYSLTIHSLSNLAKRRNSKGEVFQHDDKQIYMVLESRLPFPQLLLTLAHEMVHVKQIAKGQYKGRLARNGRLLSVWRGKTVKAEYLKRPWEIEAFARQMPLLEELLDFVAKKAKKKG